MDIAVVRNQAKAWIGEGMIPLLAGLLISLCSWIAIPLPFSPVPLVLQNSLILFLPLWLGRERAASAVTVHLIQGAVGLPVFAGCKGGLAILLGGPTAGYLVAYFLSPWIVSAVFNALPISSQRLRAFLAMATGNIALYALGALWLSTFLGISGALLAGVLPFILTDALKLVAFSHLFGERMHASGCGRI